ncbi:MAG: hypothetical protein F6K41_07195 [Symploca sp. SIO3E6]|nr:hypothetical protein [Caldora sp. SIO3E6]
MKFFFQKFIYSILLLFFMDGCTPSFKNSSSARVLYQKTINTLDMSYPGYGIDTAFTKDKLHYPMAYALVASAESHRYLISQDRTALKNAVLAAKWLIENKNLSDSKDVGWGLPFAWDAFGDGSINSANTIYTITTALVIQSLLDVYVAISSTSNNQKLIQSSLVLNTAIAAAETFTKENFQKEKEELIFWYSLNPEDSYHVINVSAMLAGQMQRLSHYSPPKKSQIFSTFADQAVLYIKKRAKFDRDGNIFWMYGGDYWVDRLNPPNDLVHESYIINGLIEYVRYGGRNANLVEPKLLYKSLQRFIKNDKIYDMPRGWNPPTEEHQLIQYMDAPARLWGVGYAIYVASIIESQLKIKSTLSNRLFCIAQRDYFDGENWYFKPDKSDANVYPRQISHLLLGLTAVYRKGYNCSSNLSP